MCRAQGEEARSMAHLLAPAAALPRVQRVWEESDHGCRRHRRGRGVGGVVTRAEHAKRESTVVSRWCPAPLGEGGREAVSEVMRGQKNSGHHCARKGEQEGEGDTGRCHRCRALSPGGRATVWWRHYHRQQGSLGTEGSLGNRGLPPSLPPSHVVGSTRWNTPLLRLATTILRRGACTLNDQHPLVRGRFQPRLQLQLVLY